MNIERTILPRDPLNLGMCLLVAGIRSDPPSLELMGAGARALKSVGATQIEVCDELYNVLRCIVEDRADIMGATDRFRTWRNGIYIRGLKVIPLKGGRGHADRRNRRVSPADHLA